MYESTATLLQEIAENMPKVYTAGVEVGKEKGKKAEYDAFWDITQQYGKRAGHAYAFSGNGWTAENFKPKYDIIVKTTARRMFAGALKNVDIEKHLNDLGIKFDTSGVTSVDGFDYFCEYSSPSVLPVIDTTGTTQIRYFAYHCSELVTIRKLKLKDDGSQKFTRPFENNTELRNIEIEGKIGNSIDFSGCPVLSKASLESIISHLSPTATFTITFSQTAVNNAFTTDEWQAIINAKPANVTISLV